MYFVIYLLEPKRNVIVPIKWVKDGGQYLEKFVNNVINCNQTFLCFYTKTNQALRPNLDIVPNFGSRLNRCWPETGCYYGKLVKFKCKIQNSQKILLVELLHHLQFYTFQLNTMMLFHLLCKFAISSHHSTMQNV